jgi:hypothetical protein
MDVVEIAEMSGAELLDHVGDLATTQRRCEIEILKAAVQHADLHDPDSLDHEESRKPGRERGRRLGGRGTPDVTEFAAAELGGRLGISTVSAGLLMADGLDLSHRLPLLWHRVVVGDARVYLARLVARKTRDLTPEQAAYVDARVAPYADGRLTWTRFQAFVDGAVAAADPEATAERERESAERQVACPVGEVEHGMRGFYVRGPMQLITMVDATLDRLARLLAEHGDEDPLERRRVKALLLLCRPDVAAEVLASPNAEPVDWGALLPAVTVYVHLYAGVDSDGVARVEANGPVTEDWIREHLGPHARFTIRPVLDIPGMAPVDAYEIPDRHRQAVHLMTPADIFPFSSSLSESLQIDHTEPFRHGGAAVGARQSRVGNYGPMSTPHHRLKTFGRWVVKQPFPGMYLWRDPHGAFYLVDHTGTRELARAA